VALVGVATIMLGGCSETGQFGNTFGSPFSTSSLPRIDKTATGSITPAPASQPSQFTDFFKEAFRPFDDKSAAPPPARAPYAARPADPLAERAIPPAPIASAPLAPPSAPSFSAPVASAPAFAPKPSYALRAAPGGIGGWSAEGGTPVVVAQGETADAIAQRFGVPTDTLLQVNGMATRAQVQPGARLTIPVYHAGGARSAAAAPARAVPAPAAPRLASKSLVGEEMQQAKQAALPHGVQNLAAQKPDASALLADKRAKLAQAKANQQKAALAQVDAAKAAKKTADLKVAAAAQVAQLKAAPVATAKTASATAKTAAATAKMAAPAVVAQAKPALMQGAAPIAPAAATKMAKAEVDADSTASLPPATASAAAGDSANPEFRWPARGRVIQGFGNSGNDGINIAVPEGTQVKAAENGVVAYAGSELKGYGNLVLIRHPNGFVTAYANNGSINVKRGDTVKRGQTIALSGQSGNVSSPQLHFELRKGSKPVDPSSYLAGL
jgi:murein DD-endopeptidase MepM/ murein hydrolase activator NlpD